MNYKYYILENNNQNVQGVISDDDGKIMYEDLMIRSIKNEFSGNDEPKLVAYYESPVRIFDAKKLVDNFDDVTITKDYWEAFYHAGGPKRKAVAESTES